MDFKDMLLDAMKQGTSLEDVMKGISAAATEVEKDQKKAAELKNRYLKYTKPLGKIYETDIFMNNLFFREKILAEDVAIVLTHYVCQNVPGYAEYAAERGFNLLDIYTDVVKSQADVIKNVIAHKDDELGPWYGVLDTFMDLFLSKPLDGKKEYKPSPPYSFFGGPIGASKSDADTIQDFLSRFDLPKN